jgi:hypothetical protein
VAFPLSRMQLVSYTSVGVFLEDREHLILHCTAHAYIREKHLATLRLLMARHYSRDTVDEIISNTEILMQCLMDSSKTRVSDILGDHSDIIAFRQIVVTIGFKCSLPYYYGYRK